MKVIDLLNRIASREEAPKKIKYKDIIFDYKKEKGDYESEEGQFFLDWVELNEYGLHDEVEIIEEDKKIEKLNIVQEKNCKNNWKWKIKDIQHDYNISTPQKIIADKINEIIDYLEVEK